VLREGEFEFGVQSVHDSSPAPPVPTQYFPAPQATQDTSAVCPVAFPYLPAPQSVQLPLPAADLYLPATQRAQFPPPLGPDEPMLQVQEAKAELPVVVLECVGQGRHIDIAEAPTDVE
jgi:hypothetical protein